MEIITTRTNYLAVVDDIPLVAEKLTPSEHAIVSLSVPSENNLKVIDCDLTTLAEQISNIVNLRLGLKAREVPDEEVFLQVIEMDCNKFPQLTTGEILKALDMGLDGLFGEEKDLYFLSSSKFVKWIRAYIVETRKPVMSKYLQLKQQIKDPIAIPSDEELKRLIASNANTFANERRKNDSHRVNGAGAMYENLERFDIWKMPLEEKFRIYKVQSSLYPDLPADELKTLCQTAAYNRFIGELVDFEMMLDQDCKIVDLE